MWVLSSFVLASGLFDGLYGYMQELADWLDSEIEWFWEVIQSAAWDGFNAISQFGKDQLGIDIQSYLDTILDALSSFTTVVAEVSVLIDLRPALVIMLAGVGTVAVIRFARWVFAFIPTLGG